MHIRNFLILGLSKDNVQNPAAGDSDHGLALSISHRHSKLIRIVGAISPQRSEGTIFIALPYVLAEFPADDAHKPCYFSLSC